MNIMCLGQAIIIIFADHTHIHIRHRKRIMYILYEKNLALWKIFGISGGVLAIVLSFFLTYLKVETGSGYPSTCNCNQVPGLLNGECCKSLGVRLTHLRSISCSHPYG